MQPLGPIAENASGDVVAAAVLAMAAVGWHRRASVASAVARLLSAPRVARIRRRDRQRRALIRSVLDCAARCGIDVPSRRSKHGGCDVVTYHPSGERTFFFHDLGTYKRAVTAGTAPSRRSFVKRAPVTVDRWPDARLSEFLRDHAGEGR